MRHILPGGGTAGGIVALSSAKFEGVSLPPNLEIINNDCEFYNILVFEIALTLQRKSVVEELSKSANALMVMIQNS